MRQISVPGQALRADLIRLLRPLGVREADAAAGAFILTLAKAVRLGPLEGGRMIANLKSGAAISAAGLQALNGHIDVGPYHFAQDGVWRRVTRCAHGAEQFVFRHGELC